MAETWRMVDTGVRPAAQNIALNRAILESRQANEIPNTLRFLQFRPSALLGFHQSAEQELNLDYCHANNIEIQRRITGGGAIYMDSAQLGWELYLAKQDLGSPDMQHVSKRICEAAARGIERLGIPAQYRPRNDIEVHGKKISGTGGAYEGDALMFQGTLLIDFSIEKMLRVLRIPAEKLSDKAISAAKDRVTSLSELLTPIPALAHIKNCIKAAFAEEFDINFTPGVLCPQEESRFLVALREISHTDWVHLVRSPSADMPLFHAMQKFAGGMLKVALSFDKKTNRIKQTWFSGDVFITPKRSLFDLESVLRDIPVEKLEALIIQFFATHEVDMQGLTPQDFTSVVRAALSPVYPTNPIGEPSECRK